ncbi:MAG: hypothetical protein QSU88_11100 [Candidatus Methanoperedens sp.]|nr:hypothetical protein [Candidatus Methanoperedens sp.]
MDIFEVLSAVSKRRINLMNNGITKHKALIKAEKVVSKEYHISLPDIQKLVGDKIKPRSL